MAIAGLVIAARYAMLHLPDRVPQADAQVPVRLIPVRLAATRGAPPIVGAWRVEARDGRLGGLSALAVDGGDLVALTDSGVVARMSKPGTMRPVARLHDLPDGPGDPRWKSRRDSEALARLADGDWLAAFENRNQVWRYDSAFRSGRRVIRFNDQGWPTNRGIEAMALAGDGALLVFPEGRGLLVRIAAKAETRPVSSEGWTVSDAAQSADGRTLLLLRRITLTGFRNAIGELVPTRAGWRIAMLGRLPLGPLDNAEGLAVEPTAPGRTRLWIVTDNDFAGYRRSVLLAMDLPARRGH